MGHRIPVDGLAVDELLYDFLMSEALPGSGIAPEAFWGGFARLNQAFRPQFDRALAERRDMQDAIDGWFRERQGQPHDPQAYRTMLESIGYLQPEGDDFEIGTENVDPEIATVAGPQLVVPVTNARFLLNAANARWGSLYDALYGTDAIHEGGGATRGGGYNPVRGEAVIARAKAFLDDAIPLEVGSHADAKFYVVSHDRLVVTLRDGRETTIACAEKFIGFRGVGLEPTGLLFRNNGLHIEIVLNRKHLIGSGDAAGVCDVVLEAALSTIVDFEDSVAVVDGADKTEAYRNWLGLMRGNLEASFQKGGQSVSRTLAADRTYTAVGNPRPIVLPGRSLLLVRNNGGLMTCPAMCDQDGEPVYEGIMDAVISSLIALHDLKRTEGLRNTKTGSIYIVRPKMHGPAEVAMTDALFGAVEEMFGLAANTLKMGLMDEERRTSLNLKACIRAARDRVVFINTGFLDRTGDEIHSAMEAGPVVPKSEMKGTTWIAAYEDNNVATGLRAGFRGRAQIGKGMWAMPDRMADMLAQKIGHPEAGANCAWVPSPTAATLHAMHYHAIDVDKRQQELSSAPARDVMDKLLTLPLASDTNWPPEMVQAELDNNVQGILGYVVRWVALGIGCSKVPDIHDVGLMEDRATLRISAQHIANWLRHGIVSDTQVQATFLRMAGVVDRQNANDPAYQPMGADPTSSAAFQAARALVFEGRTQPSGYTEPLLYRYRQMVKAERQPETIGS